MLKNIIEQALKEYKVKKSKVEATEARIQAYEYAIAHPEIWEKSYVPGYREIGMPQCHSNESPVERIFTEKELTTDTIRQYIEDDKSRIFPLKMEVEQIEKALKGLTAQEKYIIECKYFEKMNWHDIELSFNNQYRQTNYITDAGLRIINSKAVDKLVAILEPFYSFVA